ncbi:MAG: hypothetical protein LKF75_02690 [Bacilli bacterium]|jgi:hypothetical protein|nr:hypothetical protein [Bacilli bacterium]MCH4210892.1 hypothetical protein [Bacilli bacterium]MCH4228594.1 hypothetical protein [Bacilli bacterium]MCH4278207.1 hypothetical protein [Bacilli bacterium]MCI2055275.1 hypothetical protein [Bacilli bacterium]
MNKKNILFACLAVSTLAACSKGTSYDGASVLKDLESVTASFLFVDSSSGVKTIANEKGDVLAEGNYKRVYLSPRGTVINDASGSYLLSDGTLKKQSDSFRSCDYGSFYFYSEDGGTTFGVKKSDGTSLVAPSYTKINWANETNYIATDSEGLVFGSVTKEIKVKDSSLKYYLDLDKGTFIVQSGSSYSLYSGDGTLLTDPFLSYKTSGGLLLLTRDEGSSVYDVANNATLLSSGDIPSSAAILGYGPSCYAVSDAALANPVVYSYSNKLTEKGDYSYSYLSLNGAVLMVKEDGTLETINMDGKKTAMPSVKNLLGSVTFDTKGSSFAYEADDGKAYLYNVDQNKLFSYDYASIYYGNNLAAVNGIGGSYIYKKSNDTNTFGLISASGEYLFEKTLDDGQWIKSLGNGALVGSSSGGEIYGPCYDKPIQTISGEFKNFVDCGYFVGYVNGGENCYLSMTGNVIAKGKGQLADFYVSDGSIKTISF